MNTCKAVICCVILISVLSLGGCATRNSQAEANAAATIAAAEATKAAAAVTQAVATRTAAATGHGAAEPGSPTRPVATRTLVPTFTATTPPITAIETPTPSVIPPAPTAIPAATALSAATPMTLTISSPSPTQKLVIMPATASSDLVSIDNYVNELRNKYPEYPWDDVELVPGYYRIGFRDGVTLALQTISDKDGRVVVDRFAACNTWCPDGFELRDRTLVFRPVTLPLQQDTENTFLEIVRSIQEATGPGHKGAYKPGDYEKQDLFAESGRILQLVMARFADQYNSNTIADGWSTFSVRPTGEGTSSVYVYNLGPVKRPDKDAVHEVASRAFSANLYLAQTTVTDSPPTIADPTKINVDERIRARAPGNYGKVYDKIDELRAAVQEAKANPDKFYQESYVIPKDGFPLPTRYTLDGSSANPPTVRSLEDFVNWPFATIGNMNQPACEGTACIKEGAFYTQLAKNLAKGETSLYYKSFFAAISAMNQTSPRPSPVSMVDALNQEGYLTTLCTDGTYIKENEGKEIMWFPFPHKMAYEPGTQPLQVCVYAPETADYVTIDGRRPEYLFKSTITRSVFTNSGEFEKGVWFEIVQK